MKHLVIPHTQVTTGTATSVAQGKTAKLRKLTATTWTVSIGN